ncbi:MAG: hypothetical protein IJD35_04495 [Clostridia bacterium]|nr:hypothetical protein [Clostridia bacterium]
MKNKLILLVLLLVALVFTFTACGDTETTTPLEGDDAKAAYDFVCEKMNALGGFEAEMLEESNNGSESASMEMSVKINFANGKKGYITTKLDDAGSLLDMTYLDGTVYCLMKSSGMEIKYKSADASLTAAFEELFSTFEEDDDEIASVAFGSRENGVYTLNLTATEATALEFIMNDFEDMEMDASDFSHVSLTMTLECNAEGYVTKMIQTLSYTVAGEAYTETTTCTYKNIGTLPEITAPADADSYMNMDEMQ